MGLFCFPSKFAGSERRFVSSDHLSVPAAQRGGRGVFSARPKRTIPVSSDGCCIYVRRQHFFLPVQTEETVPDMME